MEINCPTPLTRLRQFRRDFAVVHGAWCRELPTTHDRGRLALATEFVAWTENGKMLHRHESLFELRPWQASLGLAYLAADERREQAGRVFKALSIAEPSLDDYSAARPGHFAGKCVSMKWENPGLRERLKTDDRLAILLFMAFAISIEHLPADREAALMWWLEKGQRFPAFREAMPLAERQALLEQFEQTTVAGHVDFAVLASGSSGNCYAVCVDGAVVLVDAGISGREIAGRLESLGMGLHAVRAIVLTHEHGDHSCSAGVLQRLLKVPVYGTAGALAALKAPSQSGLCRIQNANSSFSITLPPGRADLQTAPSAVSVVFCSVKHVKATDPVVPIITVAGRKIAIVSDLGSASDGLVLACKDADLLCIESNYDLKKLQHTPRYYAVKSRLDQGGYHLSNTQALEFAKSTVGPKTRALVWVHISGDANDMCLLPTRDLLATMPPNLCRVCAAPSDATPLFFNLDAANDTLYPSDLSPTARGIAREIVRPRTASLVLPLAWWWGRRGGYSASGGGFPCDILAGNGIIGTRAKKTNCSAYTFAVILKALHVAGKLTEETRKRILFFWQIWNGQEIPNDYEEYILANARWGAPPGTWAGTKEAIRKKGCTLAVEWLGVGRRLGRLAECEPGDIMQLWRQYPNSGHSVIVLGQRRGMRGELQGIDYISSQGSMEGIDVSTEYFEDAPGKKGTLDGKMCYGARIL